MTDRAGRVQSLFWISAAIALWLFAFRNLINSGALAWGDFPMYPIRGAGALASRVIYAWQPVGLGFSDYTFPGRLVLSLLIALLGNDASIAHNVYYLSLLPLAFLSFYLCTTRVIESRLARVIAALLFVMNPVAIGQFGGGSPELLLSYALIPLAALCFIHLGRAVGRDLVLWVLASAAVIAIGFSFYLSFLLVSIPLLVLPLVSSVKSGLKRFTLLPVVVFLSYALALLLTITLSVPLLQSAFGSNADTLASLRPGNTIDSFLDNIKLTYGLAIPLSTLRLAGNLAATDFWLGYKTPGDLFNLAGFAIPLVAFAAMLWKVPAKRYTLGFAALAMSIVSYLYFIQTWGPPRWLFEHLSILVGARNPVPLMLVAAFAMSVLFGSSLGGWLESSNASRSSALPVARALPVALAVVGLSIYGWPIFTGDMGTHQLFGGPVSIPSVYHDIGKWLSTRPADASERVLLLPYDDGSRVAMGLMPLRVVEDQLDRSQNRYSDFVFDTLVKGQSNNLGTLLAPLNVRYVVVNLDSSQQGAPNVYALYGPYLHGSPQEYQRIMDRQADLQRVFTSPDFLVYENAKRVGEVAFFADTRLLAAGQPIDPIARIDAVSPTEFRADVPPRATAVLFNETFDAGWVATRDGCQLARLDNAYSMNAFLTQSCPSEQGRLIIEYAPQRDRFVLLAILAAAWGLVLSILLFRPVHALLGRISSSLARRR